MNSFWISILSGAKVFVAAAAAQIAVLISQGIDPWEKYQLWIIAGILALVKGSEKAITLKASDKVLVPKSDVCVPAAQTVHSGGITWTPSKPTPKL